jgi:hypothetical protein
MNPLTRAATLALGAIITTIGIAEAQTINPRDLNKITSPAVRIPVQPYLERAGVPASTQNQMSGTDLPGSDYRSFDVQENPSSFVTGAYNCLTTCSSENQCQAWTYVSLGGNKGKCWLKNSVPQARSAANATSGVAAKSFEPGVHREGYTFKTLTLDDSTAQACQRACDTEGQCYAWSHYVQSGKGICRLKSETPAARAQSGYTSGVKIIRPN